MDCDVEWLRALIRHVDDFPEPGIRFADITTVLGNADALRCAVELLADEFVGRGVDSVAGIDARGFILGAPVACRLGCGFIPIRKPDKLPADTLRVDYTLEYGSGSLEVHADAAAGGQRVLIIDDVLATGGTALAAAQLVEQTGASVEAIGFLATIAGLDGLAQLDSYETVSILGEV
ncbi:MAG: adenine phosphoribosyltransferase [Actinomycetota bacterium]